MGLEEDYREATRKITELSEKVKAQEEFLGALRSDAAYAPVRDLIRKIDSGTYTPEPAAPAKAAGNGADADEEPKWFKEKYAPKLTAWEKQLESEQKRKVQEAIKKIDADEAAFREANPHIPDEYFGPKGKINDMMARHGVDDFGVGARMAIPLELLTTKPKAARPKAPLGGKPPVSSDDDDDEPQSEGAAVNRARERWLAHGFEG